MMIPFTRPAGAMLLVGILSLGLAPRAHADETLDLIDQLGNKDEAEAAVDKLVKKGAPAVKHLLGEALEGSDLTKRGWAIVCLSEIGGDKVKQELKTIHENGKQPVLVRTWAAAARVKLAKGVDELSRLAGLVSSFPALGRPIAMRLVKLSGNDPKQINTMLLLTTRYPQLNKALGKAIAAKGPDALIKAMLTAPTNSVRRRAAAFLGGIARGDKTVAMKVAKALTFKPKTKPPWDGNALFLPGIRWDRKSALALMNELVRWYLWAEVHNRADLRNQLHNNMRSWALFSVLRYRAPWRPPGAAGWLTIWRKVVGTEGIRSILEQQKLENDSRYSGALR